tara:strand:+ start:220 stop:441 length:222 start_codon:yes stop_codon:yes gene_type:complete
MLRNALHNQSKINIVTEKNISYRDQLQKNKQRVDVNKLLNRVRVDERNTRKKSIILFTGVALFFTAIILFIVR